jgi:3-oxoacyl-(acyl-carrier-protein) synthase
MTLPTVRVAVTGMGVVSPLGDSAQAAFDAAAAGRSGVALLNTPFAHRLAAPIAAAAPFDPTAHFESRQFRMLDRVSQFAVVAAKQAITQAACCPADRPRAYLPERCGVFVGTGMGGHMLGATGALECVLSLMAMQHRVALPTMHLDSADPECDLDFVPHVVRRNVTVRTMLSNSFAFGGTNAVLALGASADSAKLFRQLQ